FIGLQQSSFQESNDQLDWVVNYDLNVQDAGIPGPQISVNPESIENDLMPGDSVDIPVEITNLSEEYQLYWNVSVEYPYSDTAAEIGTLLSSFDATDLTSNTDLRGIAFTEDHMFLSSSDNFSNDQFQLYKLSKDGSEIIETYDLFSLYSGWTTITSDDRYIYGAQQYQINQFDPLGDSIVNTFPKPSFSPKGLAYDPAMEHFYMGGLNGSIKVIDKSGEELNFFITDFPIEGLTWDKWSQGGPFLWAYYYDESQDVIVANRLDPSSGGSTGVFFNTTDTNNENAMPKDITVTPHQVDDKLVLGALNTTDDNGYVNFYDLATTPAPDWIEVIPPSFGETEPFGQSTFNIRLNSIMEDTLMTAQVRISSNDVSQPEVIIPVNFEMMPLNPTNIETEEKNEQLISSLYPNPAKRLLNLEFNNLQKAGHARLISVQGAAIKEIPINGHKQVTINLAGLTSGFYILEVKNQRGKETRKIIVRR
ncbi:MAG TPA: T9SS type A sorting domain-containing protein, partial [Bacteroidales bacterium]|nr:T9SS type A sorting domain-containing protein [Bacteroidales bacterium]